MRLAAWLVGIVVLVGAGTYLGFQIERMQTKWVFVFAGTPTLLLAAVGGLWAHKREQLKEWLTPSWGDISRGFAGAVVLFLFTLAAAKLLFLGTSREVYLVRLYGQLGSPTDLQPYAVPLAIAIALLAAGEEILWRGFVTGLLTERIGARWAWVASAGLYGLAHVPTMFALEMGGLNPILPLAAVGGGLVWGGMARLFHRLTPSILAHALFDWCILMMFPLWSLSPAPA
jgi:membrane protease YdiL (CAAX protease family)